MIMRITIRRLWISVAVTLFAAAAGGLSAKTFTVDSTGDPEVVDPSNCMVGSGACSLRDALAAADETRGRDVVVFDVDDTIYLTRQLTVHKPVIIDGGDGTVVRVDQRYEVTTLPDRPELCDPCTDLPVLQPFYFSERGPFRPMLELRGDGSTVKNMVIDGSITPDPADLGVERIDWESDDLTDFFLYTIDSDGNGTPDRWLVSGGIFADFGEDPGSVKILDNELRNFSGDPIFVAFSRRTEIAGNIVTGGAAGQEFFSGDGIAMYDAVRAMVHHNTVRDYRTGLGMSLAFGAEVIGNQFDDNVTGLGLFSSDGNAIRNNEITSNDTFGILVQESNDNSVTRNNVQQNGSGNLTTGGIAVGFGQRNSVSWNEVSFNPGLGIVVEFGSRDNVVEKNEASYNVVGILLGEQSVDPDGESPLPPQLVEENLVKFNESMDNGLFDVVDLEAVCNDVWFGNTFGTSLSASGDCID